MTRTFIFTESDEPMTDQEEEARDHIKEALLLLDDQEYREARQELLAATESLMDALANLTRHSPQSDHPGTSSS